MPDKILLYIGDRLENQVAPTQFSGHLGRQAAFWEEVKRQGLDRRVRVAAPRQATPEELRLFHDDGYIKWVQTRSRIGAGLIDDEDTPAYPGIFEDQAMRVGSAADGVARIMSGEIPRTFQPVGGLHHARRHRGAGLCVFSDIGVAIEILRRRHGLRRIAYVDIDAHHGDGIFYSYESDPAVIFADIHEDGRFLYPGTGSPDETGKGDAAGTKLNIALAPGAEDHDFFEAWARVETHLRAHEPEFLILQCGADSIAGDPLADLRLSPAAHRHAARRLVEIAEECTRGRMMVFGGGGSVPDRVAVVWAGVLQEMV